MRALDGSIVEFRNGAIVTGSGSFLTFGTGLIQVANSATLENLTFIGNLSLANNATTTLVGTLTNNGTLSFANAGSGVDLRLSGSVTLAGTGIISLNNFSNNRIFANSSGDRLTIGSGQTIQGSGNLGLGQTTFTNNGTIIANQSNALVLQPGGGTADFINNGTFRADNAILQLTGGTFSNAGTITAINGGTLRFNATVNSSGLVDVGNSTLTATGTYTQSAGTFRLAGGSVQSSNALNFQGGLIDAFGNINAAIMNNAMLRPALGGSGLNVTGNISLLSASNLVFQLGGLVQGSEYGFIGVNGTVLLGGQLVLSFVNGFQASGSDVFTLMITNGLSGSFLNIASGGRLTTSDGSGSFLVDYSQNNLVLSNFVPSGMAIAAIWTGTSGNWSDGTRWSTNPNFPNNGQPGANDLYDATLSNGATITLDLPITIQRFTLTSGTVTGANPLTANQLFTWNSGTLAGGVNFNANGGLLLNSSTVSLNGSTLNNAVGQNATLTGAGAQIAFLNGAIFNNNGTFFAQNNNSLFNNGGGGLFNNIGTFTRNTGTGTFTIGNGVVLNNTGTVQRQ